MFHLAFKTENRKITDIFQRVARYNVPRYQRDYVWTKVNWQELIKDIEFTMNMKADAAWSHFLGTIVLSDATSINRSFPPVQGVKDYEIIDGQQRLTTLYILFIVIYHRFSDENGQEEKSKYIKETFLTALASNGIRNLMLNNSTYNHDFEKMIDDQKNTKTLKNKILSDLYHYFDSELKKYSINKLNEFLDKLLNINIVEIISDQEEEIYNIFEVLNARGKKLRQIELLKNHIMKYIQPRNDHFIDEAREKWAKIVISVSFLNNPDDFIIHFAKSYIAKQADNKESVYRLIKDEVHIDDLASLLDNLLEYSHIYKKIALNDQNHFALEYFSLKRNQQIRPLFCSMYKLLEKKIINEDLYNKVIFNVRNFFFVFNSNRQTSNKTDKIISEHAYLIYNCISSYEFKLIVSNLFIKLEELVQSKDVKNEFKNNPTFKYSNKEKNLKRNGQLVKYILVSLANIEQFDTELNYKNLTIEHLMNDDGYTDNANIQNLTITTDEINSEILKDKPISDKIALLRDKSSIRMNQDLSKYFNIETGFFDFDKRKENIVDLIFDHVFKFNSNIFSYSKEQIKKYFNNVTMLENDPELLETLKKTGINFEVNIKSDPQKAEQLERYNKLKDEY